MKIEDILLNVFVWSMLLTALAFSIKLMIECVQEIIIINKKEKKQKSLTLAKNYVKI